MPDIASLARYVSRVDQRYVIERQISGRNLASVEAFPADPSEFLRGQVYTIDEEHEMRHQPGGYGPDGVWPTVGFRIGAKLEYSIRGRQWLVRTSNLDEQTSDPVLQIRRRNLAHAHKKVRINREIEAWGILRDNTVITQGVTLGAGSRFDDLSSSSSDPIAVMRTGALTILRNTGLQVDGILMNREHLRMLGLHERVQSYAVNQLNLSKDRLVAQMDAEILELLLGAMPSRPDEGLIRPGSVKVTDFMYSNAADQPRAVVSPTRLYANGPDVIMFAKATPGGKDGSDNGFGLLKYLSGIPGGGSGVPTSGINFDFPISGGGNDGIMVVDLPDFEVAGGGTKTQILDYSGFFIQKAEAAYLIAGALNTADTTSYGSSLTG
jgi:hypothetical protein